MTSRRQQLFDAVIARFQTITKANGYETDIGKRVSVWRDVDGAPFAADELPAINVKDPNEESQSVLAGVQEHNLTIQVDALDASKNLTQKSLHSIDADIKKAIGQDRHWTVNNVKLAFNTEPGKSEMDVKFLGKTFGGVRMTFTIKYRTKSFDPYNTQ